MLLVVAMLTEISHASIASFAAESDCDFSDALARVVHLLRTATVK
jgi:hypothetical protein